MPMLKWTVELAVDSSWVADGFDLTDELAKEMLNSTLPYAYGHELRAKVTKYAPAVKVAKLQGYRENAKNPDYTLQAGRLAVETKRKAEKL